MYTSFALPLLALTVLVAGVEAQTVVEGQQQFAPINGRPQEDFLLQFKIGMPSGDSSKMGLHVLLHGDGGSSFDQFPNQNPADNLIGVVIKAPNAERTWGGARSNADRANNDPAKNFPDGQIHSSLIHSLLSSSGEIAKKVKFDPSKIFFTGVSGGSLLLSGFLLPMFANEYKTGALLICGGLPRQVDFNGGANVLKDLRVHYQSSQQELTPFKTTIPESINKVISDLKGGGVSDADINKKYTVNASPQSGHCAIDGSNNFDAGVKFATDNFGAIMGLNNKPIPSSITPSGITQQTATSLYQVSN